MQWCLSRHFPPFPSCAALSGENESEKTRLAIYASMHVGVPRPHDLKNTTRSHTLLDTDPLTTDGRTAKPSHAMPEKRWSTFRLDHMLPTRGTQYAQEATSTYMRCPSEIDLGTATAPSPVPSSTFLHQPASTVHCDVDQ